jgi:hypothetical protein
MIVLAQYRGIADPDTGGSFTVKRYSSEKIQTKDGSWRHIRIVLEPLNSDYQPIFIPEEEADDFTIIAECLGTLRGFE